MPHLVHMFSFQIFGRSAAVWSRREFSSHCRRLCDGTRVGLGGVNWALRTHPVSQRKLVFDGGHGDTHRYTKRLEKVLIRCVGGRV